MNRSKFLMLIVSISICSSMLFAETSKDKDIKIPTHVFLMENLFIPGAGHMYNDHLGLAFWGFFGTVEPFIFAGMYYGSASKMRSDSKYATEPSLLDVQNKGGQRCYLDNREYRYNADIGNTFLLLGFVNYIDSFIESYFAANKGLDENIEYNFGFSGFASAIRTRSIINQNANIANSQDAQMSVGLAFSANYGRIFEKEVYMHLGPHLIVSYDYMYPIHVNKWLSILVGNHFDMQKKFFNTSLNAAWTSYDRYNLVSDVMGIGASIKPYRWMSIKAGVGILTLSTAWQSFADSSDLSFSQAHAGKTGLFTTTYLWGSSRIDVYKDFFIAGRFKYISSREPQPNYSATLSYIDFIRLEAIIGVSF